MENGHPAELELLAHVDEGPRSARGREVAAHVRACEECAATVRDLQDGQTALRSAPRLELSRERRAAISGAIAAQAPGRRSSFSPGRVAALLAPVAVVAVVVIAVDTVRDGEPGGDAAAPTRVQAPEESAGEGAGAQEDSAAGGNEAAGLAGPVASVAGPPADVLRLLRDRGLTARMSGGRIVVSDATADEVLEALRGRRQGRVSVVLE